MTLSETKTRRKTSSIGQGIAFGLTIPSLICILLCVSTVLCLSVAKLPPQIFGNNDDHFRAHVISPIPKSVRILNVEADDLIIHPDVAYYFRFSVNRNDLEKIIASHSLVSTNDDCFVSSAPKWWIAPSLKDVEIYTYHDPDKLIITLCYDVPSQTAYYSYWTY